MGNKTKWEYRNIKILSEVFKPYSPVISTTIGFWCDPATDIEELGSWCYDVERSRFFNHHPLLEPYSIIINTKEVDDGAWYRRKLVGKPFYQSFSITSKFSTEADRSITAGANFKKLMKFHKPIIEQFIDKILDMEGVPVITKKKSDKRMSYRSE